MKNTQNSWNVLLFVDFSVLFQIIQYLLKLLLNDENIIYFFQGPEEPIYDTDHTDLNSDYDEAELRRELLKDVRIHLPKRFELLVNCSFDSTEISNTL